MRITTEDTIQKLLKEVEDEIIEASRFLHKDGKSTKLNDQSNVDPIGDDPFETRSFTRGKLVGLYIARDKLRSLIT